MLALMDEWRAEFDFIVVGLSAGSAGNRFAAAGGAGRRCRPVGAVGFTTKPALERAYKLLFMHRKDPARPAIGVLLNFFARRSSAYYGYYGYYGSKKYDYQQA